MLAKNITSMEIIEDYVFETPYRLPQGTWQITIIKGCAWVFCEQDNFALNTFEEKRVISIYEEIIIRRLYVKDVVKFTAVRLA